MGAKRSVLGRSQPYDVLLAAYQKKNQAKQQSTSPPAFPASTPSFTTNLYIQKRQSTPGPHHPMRLKQTPSPSTPTKKPSSSWPPWHAHARSPLSVTSSSPSRESTSMSACVRCSLGHSGPWAGTTTPMGTAAGSLAAEAHPRQWLVGSSRREDSRPALDCRGRGVSISVGPLSFFLGKSGPFCALCLLSSFVFWVVAFPFCEFLSIYTYGMVTIWDLGLGWAFYIICLFSSFPFISLLFFSPLFFFIFSFRLFPICCLGFCFGQGLISFAFLFNTVFFICIIIFGEGLFFLCVWVVYIYISTYSGVCTSLPLKY